MQTQAPICNCHQPAVQQISQKTGYSYWICPNKGRRCQNHYENLNGTNKFNPPPQSQQGRNQYNSGYGYLIEQERTLAPQPPVTFTIPPYPPAPYLFEKEQQTDRKDFLELKTLLEKIHQNVEILLEGNK